MMSSRAIQHLGFGVFLVGGLSACLASRGFSSTTGAASESGTKVAAAEAKRDPCSLVSAIRLALQPLSRGVASPPIWRISFDTGGCCTDTSSVEMRAVIVSLDLDGRSNDLLDWNGKCGDSDGGPVAVADGVVSFHYLELSEQDVSTLMFSLTPTSFIFEGGKKVNSVIRGCPDVQGVARLVNR
jgi:hypothetical protein